MGSRQRLAAVRAALRAGAKQHTPECAAKTTIRGAAPLTPGCPYCEQIRANLDENPPGTSHA